MYRNLGSFLCKLLHGSQISVGFEIQDAVIRCRWKFYGFGQLCVQVWLLDGCGAAVWGAIGDQLDTSLPQFVVNVTDGLILAFFCRSAGPGSGSGSEDSSCERVWAAGSYWFSFGGMHDTGNIVLRRMF